MWEEENVSVSNEADSMSGLGNVGKRIWCTRWFRYRYTNRRNEDATEEGASPISGAEAAPQEMMMRSNDILNEYYDAENDNYNNREIDDVPSKDLL